MIRTGARGIGTRWILVGIAVLTSPACDDRSAPSATPAGAARQSNAVAAGEAPDPDSIDVALLEPNPVYPIVASIAGNTELEEAAAAAEEISDALDKACEALEMSEDLASRRPNGTGCPRPKSDDPAEFVGPLEAN